MTHTPSPPSAPIRDPDTGHSWRNLFIGVGLRIFLTLARLLPYRARVVAGGALIRRVVAPLAGYDLRVRENLALIMPELDQPTVERLVTEVCDNTGRALIEIFSGAEFVAATAASPVSGPGLAAAEAAQKAGQPVIFISGHFGNYDVVRAVVTSRGLRMAGLYRPFSNPYFNDTYVRAMGTVAKPIVSTGPEGLRDLLRFLKGGGIIGVLHDQAMSTGLRLEFMGHPALTPLSPADMALRHKALLIPVYATRQADGFSFTVEFEAPIPHGAPEQMMQAANDSLGARVRAHPGQWFWIHRRWK